MRLFKFILVILQGGRCFRCKHYCKPYKDVKAGYCRRWNDKFKLDEDMCADFERMDRRAK